MIDAASEGSTGPSVLVEWLVCSHKKTDGIDRNISHRMVNIFAIPEFDHNSPCPSGRHLTKSLPPRFPT